MIATSTALLVALAFAPSSQERAAPATDAPPSPQTVLDALDADAKTLIDQGIAPGMVVGVLSGDAAAIRGYGKVDPARDDVPDGRTVYEIGSVSKVFTGVLLADACAREVVTLDTTVQRIYGDAFALDVFEEQPIRLRHLTTHTSGLPRLPSNLDVGDDSDPYADYGAELLFAFLDGFEPTRAPGAQYEYSNLAVGLLGDAVARAQGTNFPDLLRDRIAEPLDMDDTSVKPTEAMLERLAPPYDIDGGPRTSWHFDVLAGAGGIRSTGNDMLSFARAALDASKTSLADALPLSMEILSGPPVSRPIAYGWHAASGKRTRWHNGQTGGYHSYLAVWPEGDAAIFVLANSGTGLVDALGNNGMRVLMGETARPIEIREAIAMETEALAEYEGRYKLGMFLSLRVRLEGDRLMAEVTGQSALRIHPEAKDRFFYRAVEAELVFERDEAGKVVAVTLHQDGRETRGKRRE